MKRFICIFLTILLIPLIGFCQSIHNVKMGYEVPSEGPFPATKVFHGDTVIITWQTAGLSGNVRIELLKENHNLATIIASQYPFNDLPKTFKIPNSVTLGKYYIRVIQGGLSSNSGLFRILGSRRIKWVNVFLEGNSLPQNVFKIGQTIAVSWDTSHLLGQVTVLIKRQKSVSSLIKKTYIISKNRPARDIPATFKIPNKFEAGYYIAEVKQGSIKGSSKPFKVERTFSIRQKK